jgi:sulfur-oxidizing protein SoxX
MPASRPRAANAASRALYALMVVAQLHGTVWAQDSGNTRVPAAVNAIATPLTGVPGDPARGRAIAIDRDLGNCMLCHALPGADAQATAGNIGPPLAGVGSRLSAGELRLRLVDSTRIIPDSVMPAYHRTDGLTLVAAIYRGKPILSAQEIEDVIAYLQGLQ